MTCIHRLDPELFLGRFTKRQIALFAGGGLTLCCNRRGLLDLVMPCNVSTLIDMREICCAVETSGNQGEGSIDQALIPWAGVSVCIHGDGVTFTARGQQGDRYSDLFAICVLQASTGAADVLKCLREMQRRFPGMTTSAIRLWDNNVLPVSVGAVTWHIDVLTQMPITGIQ